MRTNIRPNRKDEEITRQRRSLVFARPASQNRVLVTVISAVVLICAAIFIAACRHFSPALGRALVILGFVPAVMICEIAAVVGAYSLYRLVTEKNREKRISHFLEKTRESGKYYMAIMAEPYMSVSEANNRYSGRIIKVLQSAISLSGEEREIEFLLDSPGRQYMCKVGDMIYIVCGIRYFTENEEGAFRKYVEKNRIQDDKRRFVLECSVPGNMMAHVYHPPFIRVGIGPQHAREKMPIEGSVQPYFHVDTNERDTLMSLIVGKYDRSLGIVNDFFAVNSYIEYHKHVTSTDYQCGSTEEMIFHAMCASGIAADLIEYRDEFMSLLPRLGYEHSNTLRKFMVIVEEKQISDIPEAQRSGTENSLLKAICATTLPSGKIVTYRPSDAVKTGLVLNLITKGDFCQSMIYHALAGIIKCNENGSRFRGDFWEWYTVPDICRRVPGFLGAIKSFAGVALVHDEEIESRIDLANTQIKNLAMIREFMDVFSGQESLIRYSAETLKTRRSLLERYDDDRLKTAIVIAEASINDKEVREVLEDPELRYILHQAREAERKHHLETLIMRQLETKREEDMAIVKDLVSFFCAVSIDEILRKHRTSSANGFDVGMCASYAASHNAYSLLRSQDLVEAMGAWVKDECYIDQYFPLGCIEHVRVVHDSMGVIGNANEILKDDAYREVGEQHAPYDECQTIPKEFYFESDCEPEPSSMQEVSCVQEINSPEAGKAISRAGSIEEATLPDEVSAFQEEGASVVTPLPVEEVSCQVSEEEGYPAWWNSIGNAKPALTDMRRYNPYQRRSYEVLKLTRLIGGDGIDINEFRHVTARDIKFHDLVHISNTSRKFKSCKISGFDQVFRVSSYSLYVENRGDIEAKLRHYWLSENELHIVLNLNVDQTPVLCILREVESSEKYEMPQKSLYYLCGSTRVLGAPQLGFDTFSHRGLLGAMLSSEVRKRIPYLAGALERYLECHKYVLPITDLMCTHDDNVKQISAQLVKDVLRYNDEFKNAVGSGTLSLFNVKYLETIANFYPIVASKYTRISSALQSVDIPSDLLSELIVVSCGYEAWPRAGEDARLYDDIVLDAPGNVQDKASIDRLQMLLIDSDYRAFHVHQTLKKVLEEVEKNGSGYPEIRDKFNRLAMGLPGVFEIANILARSFYSDEKTVSGAMPCGEFSISLRDSTFVISRCGQVGNGSEAYVDVLTANAQSIKSAVYSLMLGRLKHMTPYACIQVLLENMYDADPTEAEKKFQIMFGRDNTRPCRSLIIAAEPRKRKERLTALVCSDDGRLVLRQTVAFMVYDDLCEFLKGKKNRTESFEEYKRLDGLKHFVEFQRSSKQCIATQLISKDYIPIGNAHDLPRVEMLSALSRAGGEVQVLDVAPSSTLEGADNSVVYAQQVHGL